ncbi:MAG: M48 family metallopeptidase [Chthoniobacterales bacterium]
MKSPVLLLALFLFAFPLIPPADAQKPSVSESQPAATPSSAASLEPAAATRAWLDTVPADKKERSDAYFEGGYWLILWNFLLTAAISLLLVGTGISAQLRDFAERTTRFRSLQVALYTIPFVLISALLQFPLAVYQNFFREHAYGMANQTFGPWFAEQLKALAISVVLTVIFLVALYAVFRKAPRTWWLWGTGVTVILQILGVLIAPIFIEPVFNKYVPLNDPKITQPILAMARANQIPVKQVFEVDASKQTKRVSANVAGIFGTTRIALNDNLLRQCSLPEIRYVMAHEMGHYVLNHVYKFIVDFAVFALLAFAITRALFEAGLRRWGSRWGVRGIADPAGLPLLALIFALISFLLTPIDNTVVRTAEVEADAFGINTSREPDGMAKVSLKLGAYRKLDPTPFEEWVFFDHPSGRARIRMAMDWKAAHLPAGGASLDTAASSGLQ